MSFWNPKKKSPAIPEETTLDRRRAMDEARGKLRRAERLKERSARVAANLEEENAINHYILRLRAATYAQGER